MAYITGMDAIDIAKLAGLQLHKVPSRSEEEPDTFWRTAEYNITSGLAKPDDYYIDLMRLSPGDSRDIILSLIGMWKASKDLA